MMLTLIMRVVTVLLEMMLERRVAWLPNAYGVGLAT